jgi:hypothetical protein
MVEPARIDVHEARTRMKSIDPPLLVLAYEDDRKFRLFQLEGAIPFSDFHQGLDSLPKTREIIFY